ncbi:MAG TPA: bifunctional diaminohydroxyphosphoribosylaminopyrimidine deaminase/5-amino-6-(5-phosphoribosylamino)uracil reductase RibD [Gemmatimonadaceae bacterium]|nr:bifunctional diaminohydroxyphosphoribosylaminopyrimidine deaminase/5-amino-6-(5-phosphoribosylamino)uracil reductase RibD [Gemmatimonadaceae bacterium]
MTDRDGSAFMRRALDLAREGWGQTAPNPMVGAVVVRDGVAVGEGAHRRYGEAHAEIAALAAAGPRARGATLYVTLEPCAHQGHTPPCADAIIAAGVTRVVIATRDPNPVAIGGAERLRNAGITVEIGDGEGAARELNTAFFHRFVHPERPFVTLKLAVSLDAAIAAADRSTTTHLTGPESRREVHRLRAGHDAIAVGVGTVLADDPQLTVRHWALPRVPLTRVVFDSTLRTPPGSGLVRTARENPVLLVARAADPARARPLEAAGVQIVVATALSEALLLLAERGLGSLIVEGGARLAGSFLGHAVVDRLIIFQAPVVLGEGALNAFANAPSADVARLERLPVLDRRVLGDDVMTTYALGAP